MASCHTLRSRYELIDGSFNSHPYSPFAHSLFAASLLVPGQHRIVRAFPWREEIEVAKFLVETDGFVKHPLLLIVVAHLDEAGKREILAQRVAVEAIVGQQPPHVRMTGKDHAIEVISLALEPVGTRKHLDDRWHPSGFIAFGRQP